MTSKKPACDLCGKTFPTELQVGRHKGGAHMRTVKLMPIPHGTNQGYQAHRRRGEQPCRKCVEAHARTRAAYRARAAS